MTNSLGDFFSEFFKEGLKVPAKIQQGDVIKFHCSTSQKLKRFIVAAIDTTGIHIGLFRMNSCHTAEKKEQLLRLSKDITRHYKIVKPEHYPTILEHESYFDLRELIEYNKSDLLNLNPVNLGQAPSALLQSLREEFSSKVDFITPRQKLKYGL
jgi:hypothetical protein